MTTNHAYLSETSRPQGSRIVRHVALALMNYYCNEDFSRSKWLKQKSRIVKWSDDVADATSKRHTSQAIDLRKLEMHLEAGRFDCDSFGLFPPACQWLDAVVQVGPNFHFVGSDGKAVVVQTPTALGAHFPLVPRLDREGMTFSSFQALLQNRIVRLRTRLLERSGDFTSPEWFDDLRSAVGECVCLIDSTLHQLYFKGQYSPLPGWKFDPAKLGERHGRRLFDKFAWVYQITGKPLHLTLEERKSFGRIKDLRNHLNHFDPPCFCYTVEDVATWLNDIRAIAQISWKIRIAVGSPLSVPLISMLLFREVVFVPRRPGKRLPQPNDVGYGSTSWAI